MDGLPDDDKEFAADNLCMNEPSFGDMVMCDHDKCTMVPFRLHIAHQKENGILSGRKQ